MRGRLWKKVNTSFKRELEQRLPQFGFDDKDGQFWIWRWQIASDLHFFVALQGFDRRDQFVLEVAWSENGEFPWGKAGDPIVVEQSEGRERLGFLWSQGPSEPRWDLAPEKTAADEAHIKARARGEHLPYAEDPPVELVLPRIEPLIHDAIEKLEQYGIPLFRRVAEAHGIKWPDEVRSEKSGDKN